MNHSTPPTGTSSISYKRHLGIVLRVGAVAAMLAFALTAGRARGQAYEVLPQKLTRSEAVKYSGTVRDVLRNDSGINDAEKKAKVEEYFKDYYLPELTKNGPDELALLVQGRSRLIRDVNGARSAAAKAYYSKFIVEQLIPVVEGRFHPAVRYNAILMIGMLDKAGGLGSKSAAILPVPEAFDYLLSVIEANPDSIQNPLKIGALVGLQRHAKYALSDANKDKLAAACVGIMKAKVDYESRSADGPLWLQCLAAETIAEMKTLGKDTSVHDAMVALLADDQRSVDYRCRVAAAIGKLKEQYATIAGVDTAAAYKAVAAFARAALTAEHKSAEEYIDRPPISLSPNEQVGEYPRERVIYRANSITDLLTALEKSIPAESKAEADAILAAAKRIHADAISDKNTSTEIAVQIRDACAPVINAPAEAEPVEGPFGPMQ